MVFSYIHRPKKIKPIVRTSTTTILMRARNERYQPPLHPAYYICLVSTYMVALIQFEEEYDSLDWCEVYNTTFPTDTTRHTGIKR